LRGSEALKEPGSAAGTDQLALEIPPDPEQVRTARLFAAAAARHFDIDEERVEDLKVAVSEACTNAIQSHAEAGLADPVRITATVVPGGVRFAIVDRGPGFHPEIALDTGEGYTPPGGLVGGSLGLSLIQALFPSLSIERNADRGMTVSILVEPSEESD
jgi:serine/threonine-protein kinase RsbW